MDVMYHSSSFLLPTIPADNGSALTYALVVLNQRLPRFTPLLWKHAQLRLCADGGANRLYDEMPQLLPHEDAVAVRNRYKPDVIKGDMDSIKTEVLDFYSNLGTKILDDSHDQDTTDLHKCISFIRDFTPAAEKSDLCILVAGALGGRFDHEVGNINVLYRFSAIRIILLSDDCLIHLLPRTHYHEIKIQSSVEGPHCGLIPIGMPSGSTSTTGLQWDLSKYFSHIIPILCFLLFAELNWAQIILGFWFCLVTNSCRPRLALSILQPFHQNRKIGCRVIDLFIFLINDGIVHLYLDVVHDDYWQTNIEALTGGHLNSPWWQLIIEALTGGYLDPP
ncbi:hypothetical protein L1049_004985 [Liquidambar formosana]|uniref:thiamine diphosphokinase n=1 Tax=Liquidambar formosana TaxID=63359 RepID=A0AAP0RQJ8_LIQFO